MGKVIGIDLGTTNSCVAVIEGGDAVVIPNSEGSRTTPSMVAFTEGGERLVGQIAKRQAITNPETTVYAVKRLIGRKCEDAEVKRSAGLVPYRIVAADNGDAWVRRREGLLAQEISAMVLAKMKQTAEDYLGEPVTEAVVTVPGVLQRRPAPGHQGRRPHRRPRRAAHHQRAHRRGARLRPRQAEGRREVAVYDLGGGTFDISILEIGDGVFEVKATNGDTFLGGEDFDQRLIDWLCDASRSSTGSTCAGRDGAAAPQGGGGAGQARALQRRARPRSTCRSSPPTRPARCTSPRRSSAPRSRS